MSHFIWYIAVNLYMCDNVTSKNMCQSQEQIDNFFNSVQKIFVFFYKDIQIDLNNYKNPLTIYNPSLYQLIDPGVKKKILFT